MKKIYLVPILCSLLMFAGCASERSNVRSIEPGEPKQHEKTVSVESTPFAISVDPKDGEDKVIYRTSQIVYHCSKHVICLVCQRL